MAREIDQHLAINCFPLGIGPDHVTVQGSEPPFPFLEQKGKVGGDPFVPWENRMPKLFSRMNRIPPIRTATSWDLCRDERVFLENRSLAGDLFFRGGI